MEFRTWQPRFGAVPEGNGTRFCVCAPTAASIDVAIEHPRQLVVPLARDRDGTFAGWVEGIAKGARYRFVRDGLASYPDPASRAQPDGVHGASEVVDPSGFPWSDARWAGIPDGREVFYELHVGTFTEEGTFGAARERLEDLARLGVTTIELMPVAAVPGGRNWGYDGAALFSPAPSYGCPDDLRLFVDTAHTLGLAVCLDVVYNHLGPDGAYAAALAPEFLAMSGGEWGPRLNLDGPWSPLVREFLIDNALHWIHEYHMDGLRLDATHAIIDYSARHFLAELAEAVRGARTAPRVRVYAEDNRNLAALVRPLEEGGTDLDGLWSDDFHHEMRRLLAGDNDGYYRDYRGSAEDLATTLRQGWLYTGQHATHFNAPRGTGSSGIPLRKFIICLQNHDQVGNRPFGDRLHHCVGLASVRAATAVLLVAPTTPLLFMGQEWAASSPFLFFTDHNPALGRAVAEGRRREFGQFAAFSGPDAAAIPDPQDAATFADSCLSWAERLVEPCASILRLHTALLSLRRSEAEYYSTDATRFMTWAPDSATVVLSLGHDAACRLVVVARLHGAGTVELDDRSGGDQGSSHGRSRWEIVLTTEDPAFSPNPRPPRVAVDGTHPVLYFAGPAAVILRGTPRPPG